MTFRVKAHKYEAAVLTSLSFNALIEEGLWVMSSGVSFMTARGRACAQSARADRAWN